METLAQAATELAWYKDRAELVAEIAGEQGGTALKDRLYLQKEYAETDLSQPIRSISERVMKRITALESENMT